MREENLLPGPENNLASGQLMLQLVENEHKIALLNQEQALKTAELTRLQQELEELNKLYTANKPRK